MKFIKIYPLEQLQKLTRKEASKVSSDWLLKATAWKDGLTNQSALLPQTILSNRWCLIVMLLIILVTGLVLVSRIFQLQVIRGREYFVLSEQNRVFIKDIFPERGVIYDRNGDILARNVPAFSVGVVYAEVPQEEVERIRSQLAELLDVSEEKITESFEYASLRPYNQRVLKKNITHDQQLAFQARQEEFPGIYMIQDVIRSYTQGPLFSAILGYTGVVNLNEVDAAVHSFYTPGSYIGMSGVEKQYEDILRGKMGRSFVEVEASGKVHGETVLKESIAGQDITLAIDSRLQLELGELLKKAVTKYGAWAGSTIVMDVRNGEILAIVSLPTYDNNIFNKQDSDLIEQVLTDSRSLLINRSLSGLYAPGSTIKVAIGAKALQSGVISSTTRISGEPQVMRVGEWEFPDWTYSWGLAPHGLMNLTDAIAESSDIFFYKIGGSYPPECQMSNVKCQIEGLGVEGVVGALRDFGLGSKTGIDLPEEVAGLVPDPSWKLKIRGEAWFLGNTYHLSIGQGDLLVTPIQVLNLANIVATDSKTPQPHLIKKRELVSSNDLDNQLEKPISLEHLRVVREGMIKAVSEGIIYPLRGAKVKVAAKTGTAEFGALNRKGEYETHAWVMGFAPIENPAISFVFMLEAGGKSSNAAELAREFIDWYFE